MTQQTIFGLSAALVTPFDAAGAVDIPRATAHARRCLEGGCDGVTLFGTTGEGYGLTLAERRALSAAFASDLPAGARITAGVMSPAIGTAAEQGRTALEDGATSLLMAPPFFMKSMSDEGLYDWFARVFDGIGAGLKGVILYHIPGQTAVPLSVELIARLRQSFGPAIAGIKDSSGDAASTAAFLAAHGDIAVLVGDERQLPAAMKKGAQGSICGFANIAPDLMRALIHDGDPGAEVVQAVDLIVSLPVLPAVKALVARVSGDAAFETVRPPLVPLTAGQKAALIGGYDAIRKAMAA